ncbi:excalibur calcium-binding domain-containing protein [Bacillus sp. UNC322MFChir4.1]|uniref:excalibur calcium-binding domain-containing protein n=1 Tax=Bacillus sp. UNC322MFChir4.1 TaxID=1449045 RepID=UPI00068B9C19|nr:excalibur calcium-binding domain-containing protein [Bacillus sp. UNC322MFChir4.1]
MLKKLVTLLICSVFAFSLAACGNNAKATENKDTKAAEQKKIEEQKKQEEEKKKQEEVKKQQESSTYEDVAVADRENNTPNSTENKVQQQPNNNLPQGESHFSSCKEAKAAGFSNISKGHPDYSSKLDRGGDGIACDK